MICTATAGVALLSRQKCPKATWGNPQDPDAPERPPGKPKGGFPERGLNGAYKVPQAHLPPPNLPRFGGGERPPILYKPPPPLTITMGLRLGSLQALTPRERRSRFPPARPSGPLSRIGKGGGGIGQMRLRLPLERICAQYGFRFFVGEKSKSVSSTASDWGLGAEPQACFGSFYTSKRNAPAASRTN